MSSNRKKQSTPGYAKPTAASTNRQMANRNESNTTNTSTYSFDDETVETSTTVSNIYASNDGANTNTDSNINASNGGANTNNRSNHGGRYLNPNTRQRRARSASPVPSLKSKDNSIECLRNLNRKYVDENNLLKQSM
eukprot:456571_1